MEDKIKELKIKKDVKIIKPYLTSLGYDLSSRHDYDLSAYYVARKDNLRYLAFNIAHYTGDFFGEPQYNHEHGQIIYDTNGNILLDCINKCSNKCYCVHGYKEYYSKLDPSYIFMDDYVLISTEYSKYLTEFLDYSIYKLENGKYTLKKICKSSSVSNVVKSSNGELFLNNYGRLYSVRNLKYLNNLKFKDIIGAETHITNLKYNIDRVCWDSEKSKMAVAINNSIKNNNLLFAYDYIKTDTHHSSYDKEATVYAFLDCNGKIVSKLYFKSEYEFKSFDVSNATYKQVVEECKNKLTNEVLKKIESEKRREKRERKLFSKAREEMIEEMFNPSKFETNNKVLVMTLKKERKD